MIWKPKPVSPLQGVMSLDGCCGREVGAPGRGKQDTLAIFNPSSIKASLSLNAFVSKPCS